MLILSIILGLTAIGFLVWSVFLFKQKGPLPSPLYLVSPPEIRQKMKTREGYVLAGYIFAGFAVLFALLAVMLAFKLLILLIGVVALSVALAVYAVVASIKSERKRNK